MFEKWETIPEKEQYAFKDVEVYCVLIRQVFGMKVKFPFNPCSLRVYSDPSQKLYLFIYLF